MIETERSTVLPTDKAPAGRLYMLVGKFYWGKGKTPKEALAKAKQAGLYGKDARGPFAIFEISPDTYVDSYGTLRIPDWTEDKQFHRVNVKGWKMAK